MRYIVMHKVDAKMEAGVRPDQAIIDGMGQLVRSSIEQGVFQNGAGLHRSAERVRLSFRGGERTLTRGPYHGQNELVAACYMIRTRSLDDAIDEAGKIAGVVGDVEIEVGPVVEPWDLGLIPKPEKLQSTRFLLLQKGSAATERSISQKTRAAVAELVQRMKDEGVLLLAEELAPSARGARLASEPKAKRRWVDGPFTESKELIAGFSILSIESKQAALAWADRYAAILGDNEVDVRELLGD